VKQRDDRLLLLGAFLNCIGAFVASHSYHQLTGLSKYVVFATLYFNPSLLLYGLWKWKPSLHNHKLTIGDNNFVEPDRHSFVDTDNLLLDYISSWTAMKVAAFASHPIGETATQICPLGQ
jgi:hypothetical protein